MNLTAGSTVLALCPMGVRREVSLDAVHGNGLVRVSYALPRGKGRRTWTTEQKWLETEGGQTK
ncbi:MAG: hypothetical protein KDB26_08400 [Microthrixaceae bacterium]|nr:hypothetical protein [Microthrixaceae bacterium]